MRYQNGEPIGVIAKDFNVMYHHIFPYITNIMTKQERRKRFPKKHKVDSGMNIRDYLEAIGPDYDRGTMIQRIHSRTDYTYTEAETYYNEWRAEYMKRRVI